MTHVTIPNRPAGTDIRSIENILADFDAITTVVNGSLDGDNLTNAVAASAEVNNSSQTVKGSFIKAGTDTTTAVGSWVNLGDSVANLVLPAAGIIEVLYFAHWSDTVINNAICGLFLGGTQVVTVSPGGNQAVQVFMGGSAGITQLVHTLVGNGTGFATSSSSSNFPADVTTGQAMGQGGGSSLATPLSIFAAAGTYTVNVNFFQSAAGTLSVSSRRLYARVRSYS